jgi:hypothetical protein
MAEVAEATKVRGVVTTSSPGPIPKTRSGSSSASEPLARAMQCCPPKVRASASWKAKTSPPVHWLTRPDLRTWATASISSSA